jgi:MprA protease rhombosortase-interaction domain-containing protein
VTLGKGTRLNGISRDGQVIFGSVVSATPPPFPGPPITQWPRWTGSAWEALPELSPGALLAVGLAAFALRRRG